MFRCLICSLALRTLQYIDVMRILELLRFLPGCLRAGLRFFTSSTTSWSFFAFLPAMAHFKSSGRCVLIHSATNFPV
jgi:hypothetical protein